MWWRIWRPAARSSRDRQRPGTAYETFSMALWLDAAYFVVDGLTVKVGRQCLPGAETKDSYTFTITITDSAGNTYNQ